MLADVIVSNKDNDDLRAVLPYLFIVSTPVCTVQGEATPTEEVQVRAEGFLVGGLTLSGTHKVIRQLVLDPVASGQLLVPCWN